MNPEPSRRRARGRPTRRVLAGALAWCSVVYLWPRERRPTDESGRHGIPHFKCAVADGRWLFLFSANLTEYASSLNMGLGVLGTGGDLPSQIEAHFDRLITAGVLVRV